MPASPGLWEVHTVVSCQANPPGRGTDMPVREYAPARAIKVTFPRAVMAGNPEDTDIDGKQQHAPLLEIDVP